MIQVSMGFDLAAVLIIVYAVYSIMQNVRDIANDFAPKLSVGCIIFMISMLGIIASKPFGAA